MSTPDCTTFSTLAIHAGFDPDPITGDVVPPIHVASTFVQDRPGELRSGYEYGRCGNPTTNAFAGALAALEGAEYPRFSAKLEELMLHELRRTVNSLSGLGVPGVEHLLISSDSIA